MLNVAAHYHFNKITAYNYITQISSLYIKLLHLSSQNLLKFLGTTCSTSLDGFDWDNYIIETTLWWIKCQHAPGLFITCMSYCQHFNQANAAFFFQNFMMSKAIGTMWNLLRKTTLFYFPTNLDKTSFLINFH